MEMRWAANWWRLGITPEGKIRGGSLGMEISDLQATASSVRFSGRCERLVFPRSDGKTNVFPTISRPNFFQFAGINPGSFTLKADGKEVYTAMDTAWKTGKIIELGPDSEQAEQLRQVILKKNQLFFHRWRPENETYLFGFRKYEQGQNAREIPQFDPLVQAEEEKIAHLRKPVKRTYELISASSSAPAKASSQVGKKEKLTGEKDSDSSKETAASTEDKKHPFTPQPLPQLDLAPDLEINLFAENPQLAKPIQMNFDPQGRLLGGQLLGLSADRARPKGRRQNLDSGRYGWGRQSGQINRLRRRIAYSNRSRTRGRRMLCRAEHRVAPFPRHRRRWQSR